MYNLFLFKHYFWLLYSARGHNEVHEEKAGALHAETESIINAHDMLPYLGSLHAPRLLLLLQVLVMVGPVLVM